MGDRRLGKAVSETVALLGQPDPRSFRSQERLYKAMKARFILSPQKRASAQIHIRWGAFLGGSCTAPRLIYGAGVGVRGYSGDAFPLRVGRRGGAPALQRRGDSASSAARGRGEAPPRARALPRLAFWAAANRDVSFDRGTSLLSLAPGPADSGCSLQGDPRRAPESIQAGCAMQAGWPPCGSPHGRDEVPLCSALWLALPRTLLLSALFFFF